MTRVLIQAVPWETERVRNVKALREQIPDAEIVWDQTHRAMDTWRDVMTTAGQDAVVCLEDDVRLAERWRERVEEVIAARPDTVIQFFSRGRAGAEPHSAPGRTFSMNQCYYLPTGMAADLAAFAPTWMAEHPEHPDGYDLLMAEHLRRSGLRYWVHAPTLVQHERWTSMISPRRARNRTSPHFDGERA